MTPEEKKIYMKEYREKNKEKIKEQRKQYRLTDYSNGKIYKIIDNTNGKIYIGSTIKKRLEDRLSEHKADYNRFLKGKTRNSNSIDIIKNGDYKIELIENYPCESKKELETRERYFIENNECINKFIPTRTKREYQQTENAKKYRKEYYNQLIVSGKGKENNKKYYEIHKQKKIDYQVKLQQYKKSWGGDERSNNNLLMIEIDLFE